MNTEKYLRVLKKRAKEGNLLSMFELYNLYLETEPEEADELYQSIKTYVSKQYIKLDDLILSDFRQFKKLKIFDGFDPNFTVIIGENGSGKTSVLEAISKCLSWLVASIIKEGRNGYPIVNSDINVEAAHAADISAVFTIGKLTKFSIKLSLAKLGSSKKSDSDVAETKSIANVYRVINSLDEIDLPLYACYLVERSYPLKLNNQISKSKTTERFDAYSDSLKGSGKFEHFVEWFIAESKKAQSKQKPKLAADKEIEYLKKKLAMFKRKASTAEFEALEIEYGLKPRVDSEEEAKKDQAVDSNRNLDIVVAAINKVIPTIKTLFLDNTNGTDQIKVETNSYTVNLSQLSDGQRIFMTLVADIARRLILLNPMRDDPLLGNGIVLIDELELHLHPSWQQNVAKNLRSVFPNIQFIVATHSPLVLSTVKNKCIRVFSSTSQLEQTVLSSPDYQSSGTNTNEILEQIMNTNSVPDNDHVQLLDMLVKDVESGVPKDDIKFKRNYNDLIKHFGENHSSIKFLDSVILVSDFKKKIIK
jgi:predicted ATP-binding protein involved in virulence